MLVVESPIIADIHEWKKGATMIVEAAGLKRIEVGKNKRRRETGP